MGNDVWIAVCGFTVLGLICLTVFLVIDRMKTEYYLRKNQREWNEYSKDMSLDEKTEVFTDWLEVQKAKNGTQYYYIPRM